MNQPERIRIHVMPVGDLREHECSRNCWCKPSPTLQPGLWIHHSMDLREEYEQGRKPS